MYLILTPFLFCRFYELYKTKSLHFKGTAQELSITSLWVLSPLPKLLWIPLSFGFFLRWYGLFRYQIDILPFLKSPKCFRDSVKALPSFQFLFFGALLTTFSCLGLFTQPSRSFWIPLLLISLFCSFFKSRKKQTPLPQLSFPNEISSQVSPQFPALRKTISFLGEKRFDIPLAKQEKPHIIFLFLESFRAKNVGCLGAEIPASPHFDAWAKKGILFRNFHANGLQTFRAFLSAYFGIPAHLRTVSLKPFCNLPLIGLPQILKNHGYHPAVIQSGDLSFDHLYPFFQKQGFETILGGEDIPSHRTSSWGIDDEAMLRFAASWLEKQSLPTFLSLFTITNHHPWKSPPNWDFSVDPSIPLPYRNFLKTFAYTDHCLNRFLEELKQKQLLDKSIIFVAGDHGQEMGERRAFSELNQNLHEENLHLPLLILAGQKIKTPMELDCNASFIDFLPTVLDHLRIQDVHHGLGNSLLRKVSSPTYFSMHREDLQIGAIMGKNKVILSNELLGFDLNNDPEEKINIGPELKTLALASKTYFQDVDAITQGKAWAPPTDQPFELKASPSMKNEDWISYIHKHPPIPVIDLSSGIFLSDPAILAIHPNYGAAWHQLSFRNCALTDLSLAWVTNHCQKLMSLDLSHCHLLTNKGVELVLSQLPTLRHLWLDGIEDLSHFVPSNRIFNLQTCSLKNLPRLKAQSLVSLYTNSPHLIDWSAVFTDVTNEDLLEMSCLKKQSTHMAITDGVNIHDESLSKLLASQEELQEIHLENFPLIEHPDFSKLTKLRYLEIQDCPRLTEAFFESLKNLPIIRLQRGLSYLQTM